MVYTAQERKVLRALKENIDAPTGVTYETMEQAAKAVLGDFKKTVLVLLREGLVQEFVKQDEQGVRTGSYLITREGLRAVRSWEK